MRSRARAAWRYRYSPKPYFRETRKFRGGATWACSVGVARICQMAMYRVRSSRVEDSVRPASATLPRDSTTKASARLIAKSRYCSTSSSEILPLKEASTSLMAATRLGWIPSVGSSRIKRLGRVTSARAIASCCCCPPESARGRLDVLPDRQFGENLAPLWHVSESRGRASMRRPPRYLGLVDQNAALRHRKHPHQAFQQRGFSGAIPAEHGQAFARHDLEADLTQHLCAAIMLIQALNAESHDYRPR